MSHRLFKKADTLFDRKSRIFVNINEHTDYHLVKELGRSGDNIDKRRN